MRWCMVCAFALAGCRTPCAPEPPPAAAVLLQDIAPEQRAALAKPDPKDARAKDVFTLPQFLEAAVVRNLRIAAGREQVEIARGDYISDSLIPNCQLLVDAQLLPITPVGLDNQGGPPQYDAALTVPIDWLLFGKRVAARCAAKLQIDVAAERYEDLVRRTVSDAALACYDLLEAEQLQKLADEDLKELEETEKLVANHKQDAGTKLDAERIKLAKLDAQREQHRRDAAFAAAKAKLRPFLGRTSDDPDFELKGTLAVSKAFPPAALAEALRLAERHRPDLAAARKAVAAADAAVVREQCKGKPLVALQAAYNYQDQVRITGFRNASFATVTLNTTLPFTDRNQGNLAKAAAAARANRATLHADLADLHAEVETAVAAYREAFDAVTNDDPASLASAERVRDGTQEAYRKGDKSLLDVLDATRAYRDRLKNIISERADYWQALHRLNAALGVRALSTAQPEGAADDPAPKAAGAKEKDSKAKEPPVKAAAEVPVAKPAEKGPAAAPEAR